MAGITAFVGLPGSGKSFSAVELAVIPALKEKRLIVTNMPLSLEQICGDFFEGDTSEVVNYVQLVTSDDFSNPQFCEDIAGGALVIIDECWRIWKSGTRVNKVDDKHMAFIKEHRHRSDENGRSLDIILVTQNLSDIAAFLREMVETTVVTEKLLAVGQANKFRRVYYQGGIKGFEASQNFLLKDEFGSYKPEIYKYYRTHMHSSSSIGGGALKVDENRAVKGSTIFHSWKFKAGAVLAVVMISIMFWTGSKSVDNYKKQTQVKVIIPIESSKPIPSTPVSIPVEPVVAVSSLPPIEPKISERWRLVGYVSYPAKNFYLISDGRISRKITSSSCTKSDFETTCRIDGEIVASYSGKRSNDSDVYMAAVSQRIEEKGFK